jgi:uncharacterized protein YbjT (DUF2867 family)
VALDVVTGAFSFTGRYIAELLLERGRSVRTLSRRPPDPEHPLAGRIEPRPLQFDDSLDDSLHGVDTLYSTYWVRYERDGATYAGAVANLQRLFEAAARAGVRRIVHLSVANADAQSPFPYYRGKAEAEERLRAAGVSHAIVRPTLVFGPNDILVNNVAWGLRRVPVFLVPGTGAYEVQPVSVFDVARIAVDVGAGEDDAVLDAAGPHRWTYEGFVRLIRSAVGARARLVRAPFGAALAAARLAGLGLRDVVLTREELESLEAGLLVSNEAPLGRDRFEDWVRRQGRDLGRSYTSELRRNFRDRD